MPLDPDDSAQSFIFDAWSEITFNSMAAAAGDTPLGKAIKLYSITTQAKDSFNKLDAAYHDPSFTNEMKMAIAVLSLMGAAGGNPMIAEMPVTVAQAWHYVFDVPDQYIDGFNTKYVTKEAFWADLHARFPADFELDGSGQLIEPTYVSYPPATADWSRPLTPFIPGALAPKTHDEVQPGFSNAISASSPLVIDLSSGHTGISLTTWNASSTETYFDLNDNDFAVQTAWVSGDTGLLARDLNSDGVINSSAELFGSPTIDGFAMLATYDSNHDLRIDNNDADWSTLVVWTDTNGDAISQTGELNSLASLGIESIDLAGVGSSTSTISGNPISHTSTIRFTSGATAAIADAWFVHDNTNSYYVGETTLDTDVFYLPELRGYGTLPDLWLAVSQDSDLKELVADFAANFTLESFADVATLKSDITDILYTWAGVSEVSSVGRGPYIDGQHVAFLEHFIGTDFLQNGVYPDPFANASTILEQAYHTAFNMLFADLLMQVGAASLFDGPVTYNAATGSFEGDLSLSQDAIGDLVDIAPAAGTDNDAFWVAVGQFLEGSKGLENLTGTELGWLESAVNATDSSLHWSDISAIVTSEVQESATDETLNGTSGAETIHGNDGNDVINGYGGNDTLYGDAGNDTIHGDSGNDTIYGGDGNDGLDGAYGNDTYYAGAGGNSIISRTGNDTFMYGGGDDIITEYGGTDQIILPSGTVLGDLAFSRVSSDSSTTVFNDLLIKIDGGGSIQIKDHFYNSSNAIETLVFADTSTLDLTALTPEVHLTTSNDNFSAASTSANYTVYGYGGNDTIYAAGTGNHTIDGGNGNDVMTGGSGSDDTYIASAGFDTIIESSGTDTIVVPVEYGVSDVSFYRIGSYDLGILISGLGQIKIASQLSSGGVENLHFLSDNSNIDLTSLSITTVGTGGNDTLYVPTYSTSHNDFVDGREGDDWLYGDSGNDTYVFSAGHDTVYETSGTDTIRVRDSYTPSDITVFFDSINNLQLIDTDGNNITVYRQAYSSGYGVEHIVFGDSTDWNLGSLEIDTLGTSGNDELYGAAYGDASTADTIYGYAGADSIYAGAGNDVIYGGDGADSLRGEDGNDTIYGGDGADNIYAGSVAGNDIVYGGAGADEIYGADQCVLYGDDGNDTLYNSASWPYAASTSVTMNGGAGADTLYGGYGVDTFGFDAATAFNAVDTIQYFSTTDDKIDIADILDGHYDPLTQAITDFVQIQTNGNNSELYVDTAGSATFGASQHIATIQGVTGITDEEALVTAGTLIAA